MSLRTIFIALLFTLLSHSSLFPAKFTVINVGDAGVGSFRDAINSANLNIGRDTIEFGIGVPGVKTITLLSALPNITDTLFIDGGSDPFYAGVPLIELNVNGLIASGLSIATTAPETHIHGLIINNSLIDGIFCEANAMTVTGCYIGTNSNGTIAVANNFAGIEARSAVDHIIGGSGPNEGNLISGNGRYGIRLQLIDNTRIIGNLIGTDISGTAAIANGSDPVAFDGAGVSTVLSNGIIVGGSAANERNIISGNLAGINHIGRQMQVLGNYIGTDISGLNALGNLSIGILIQGRNNKIGGSLAGEGNLISGNLNNGISISAASSYGNEIQGNLIGTNLNANVALPNGANGIDISNGSKLNTIGGIVAGSRNIISSNTDNGINFSNTDSNYVYRNFIGTDGNGNVGLGNTENGIAIISSAHTFIGDGSVNGANVISSNSLSGILITGLGSDSNMIKLNYIGTDPTQVFNLANGGRGILAEAGAQASEIGGLLANEGNAIAHNAQGGIEVNGNPSTRHQILRNSIFDHPVEGIKLSGGNNLQAAPVLTGFANGANTTIFGTFNSAPNTTYRLEFFTSPTSNQGKTFIGSSNITTDATGFYAVNEVFAVTITAAEPIITSTATAPNGDTSPFGVETVLFAEIQELAVKAHMGQSALLSWKIEEQEGAYSFDIEREEESKFVKIGETDTYESVATQRIYSFTSKSLPLGKHRFRLLQKGPNGSKLYSKTVELSLEAADGISLSFENPFKAGGQLSISLQEAQRLEISLIDLQGKQLASLFSGRLEASENHKISLDKLEQLAAGMYFIKLESAQLSFHKMIQKR
ncbi:MAG: T9SS type A sorting domain-containing protein [Bacteroidota bacterium]